MSYEQTNDDQLYIEDGYFTPDGYYVYVAEAQSTAIVEASLSVTAIRITEATATLTVEATVTTTLSNIYGADLFAFSEAQIAVTVDLIRDNNVAATAQFDTATDGGIVFDQQSAIESQFGVDAQAERSRATDSAVEAAFSFVCTISHIEGADIIATGFASLAADVVKTAVANSDFTTSTTQSTTATRIQRTDAALSSLTEFFVSRNASTGRPRNLSGTATYSTSIKRFGTHSLLADRDSYLHTGISTRPRLDQDFVAQFWWYPGFSTNTNANTVIDFGWLRLFTYHDRSAGFVLYDNSVPTLVEIASFRSSAALMSTSQWSNIAIVKNSAAISFYINGTRRYTTASTVLNSYTGFRFGAPTVEIREFNMTTPGYIDEIELRVGTIGTFNPSNASITVPTTQRTNDPTTTQVLYHFDNNLNDDVTNSAVTHQGDSALSSTATVSASITTAVDSQTQMSAAAQVDATIGSIKPFNAELIASGGVIVVYDKLIRTEAVLVSSVAVSAEGNTVISAESIQLAEFQQSIDFLRIRSSDVVFDSVATALTAIAITTDTVLDVVVSTDLTAAPVKTTDSTSIIESATGLDTTATRIQQITETLNSQADLQADAVKIADFSAVLDLVAGTVTMAVKTADYIIECTDFATLSATAQVSSDVQCSAQSAVSVTAAGDRIRFGDLTLSAESQLTSQPTSQIQGSATLQMFNSVTANIRTLHIDIYEYRIPRESWTYKIGTENRQYSIENENRLYKIRR